MLDLCGLELSLAYGEGGGGRRRLPFGLVLLKHLALGVVADHLGSEIAKDVQLLGTESCGAHFEVAWIGEWTGRKQRSSEVYEVGGGADSEKIYLIGISAYRVLHIDTESQSHCKLSIYSFSIYYLHVFNAIERLQFLPSSSIQIYENLPVHLLFRLHPIISQSNLKDNEHTRTP